MTLIKYHVHSRSASGSIKLMYSRYHGYESHIPRHASVTKRCEKNVCCIKVKRSAGVNMASPIYKHKSIRCVLFWFSETIRLDKCFITSCRGKYGVLSVPRHDVITYSVTFLWGHGRCTKVTGAQLTNESLSRVYYTCGKYRLLLPRLFDTAWIIKSSYLPSATKRKLDSMWRYQGTWC